MLRPRPPRGRRRARCMFFSNHTSHLDATMIMTTLPDALAGARPRSARRRDYFFDVWWRQAFTALVYGAFPIDRGAAATRAIEQGARAARRGLEHRGVPRGRALAGRPHAAVPSRRRRACALEAGVGRGADRRSAARTRRCRRAELAAPGRPPVSVRYGRPLVPARGRDAPGVLAADAASRRRAARRGRAHVVGGAARAPSAARRPSLAGPTGAAWRRKWEGSRPIGAPRPRPHLGVDR